MLGAPGEGGAIKATIISDLTQLTFDRVDRVKEAVGEEVLKGDDRLWILGQELFVSVDAHEGPDLRHAVAVPEGFVTDGASVPYLAQVLTGWRPWDEPHRWGAIVHDWLYCMNGQPTGAADGFRGPYPRVAKAWADLAFRATLQAAGASSFRAAVMYQAVRLFGGHAYAIDQKTGPTIRA